MTDETNDANDNDEPPIEPRVGFKIQKVRVFVTQMPDGKGEGIVATPTQQGVMPLVALDDRQYAAFCDMAQEICNNSGSVINVAEFTTREDVAKFEKQLVQVPKMGGAKIGDGSFAIGQLKPK